VTLAGDWKILFYITEREDKRATLLGDTRLGQPLPLLLTGSRLIVSVGGGGCRGGSV